MSRLVAFVAGFVVCAVFSSFTFVLFAQTESSPAYSRPVVVDVSQSVPVTATLGLVVNDERVTVSVPLMVDVALQVHVSGYPGVMVSNAAKPLVSVKPISAHLPEGTVQARR